MHHQLAVNTVRGVAIANRGMKDPVALFDPCTHFLDNLATILFALELALSSDDRFDELTFGRFIVQFEVQALDPRTALLKFPAKLDVEFGIAGEAFQVIEDDDIVFAGLGI
nr:hypothetical protein [Martelella radicis]